MSAVDKLIFNALVRREGVRLPGIGSLTVESKSARAKGKKIYAPLSLVVFKVEEDDRLRSVVEIIAAESGMDFAQAEEVYAGWKREASTPAGVKIEGVGEVFANKIAPSTELNEVLNPDQDPFRKLKRRKKRRGWWWLILLLLACLAGAYLCLIHYCPEIAEKYGVKNYLCNSFVRGDAPVPEVKPQVVDTLACVKTDTLAADSAAVADTVAVVEPVSHKPYQVVAGVYSTRENVDKFLRRAEKRGVAKDKFTVIPLANGKFLVSLGGADSNADARVIRREYLWFDSELWVYKMKPEDGQPVAEGGENGELG